MKDLKLLDDKQTRYILSTGRTGTTQLREFLKEKNPNLNIAFEPSPSRLAFILWNAGLRGALPKNLGRNLLYEIKQKEILKTISNQVRIEFDSYLSPLLAEMLDYSNSPVIIHMVRHPYSWIRSTENFKAAHWRRYVVDYFPFAKVIHPHASAFWNSLGKIEKSAWRWVYYNERLLECKKSGGNYICIKYEDFISSDSEVRNDAVNKILNLIDPDYNEYVEVEWKHKMNKSIKGEIDHWSKWEENTLNNVRNICGNLMETFNYSLYP